MNKTKTALAAEALAAQPARVIDRAQVQLAKIRAYIDVMPPEGQMAYAVAMGTLQRWAETHGVAGDLALAVLQLERTAGMLAEPTLQ